MNDLATIDQNNKLAVPFALGEGREELSKEEMLIPRLKLAQALSDEMKKSNEKFMPELELGQFFNSVTGEIYGAKVTIVPLRSFTEYIEFDKSRKVVKFYQPCELPPSEDLAVVDGEKPKCTKFLNRMSLLIKEDGSTEPIVIGFKYVGRKKTPMLKLNTLMAMKPESDPVYGYNYTLESIIVSNEEGEWYSGKFSNGVRLTAELVERARYYFNALTQDDVKVDDSAIEAEEDADTSFDQ